MNNRRWTILLTILIAIVAIAGLAYLYVEGYLGDLRWQGMTMILVAAAGPFTFLRNKFRRNDDLELEDIIPDELFPEPPPEENNPNNPVSKEEFETLEDKIDKLNTQIEELQESFSSNK